MRFLIVDQCSGRKAHRETSPVFDIDTIDEQSLKTLLERPEVAGKPARHLYDGRQQARVDAAVDTLRDDGHDVERYFISAGFGLVDEREELPPYEATFNDMTVAEIRDRSAALGITEDLLSVLDQASPFDVVALALGSDYYTALELEALLDAIPEDTHVVLFNAEDTAADRSNVVSVPARTDQAAERGCIVVELKGQYLETLADNLAAGKDVSTPEDLREYCLNAPQEQAGFDQF